MALVQDHLLVLPAVFATASQGQIYAYAVELVVTIRYYGLHFGQAQAMCRSEARQDLGLD